jgi:hypothetical protein
MDSAIVAKVGTALADVKQFIDGLEAAGISSPALDAADKVIGDITAATQGGKLDPRAVAVALIPLEVAGLNDLAAVVPDPMAKLILTAIARLLGKFSPAPAPVPKP